jgi:hypothetical protein
MMKGFIHHKGKGEQVLLPNRAAANQLTKGETWQRSANNYAKVTPSGEGALDAPDVLEMAQIKY